MAPVAVAAAAALMEAVVPMRLWRMLPGPAVSRQVGVAAVAPLGVGATTVVGRAPSPLLKVPMPLALLVPIKVPAVPFPVAAVAHAVLTAAVQVVQDCVRQGRRHGDSMHALVCTLRRAVAVTRQVPRRHQEDG